MIICNNCKGNGYVKIKFEAEESIMQCEICDSQGTLDENKHYHQTWSDGVSDDETSFYYGPPLDPESFKNYKIYKE